MSILPPRAQGRVDRAALVIAALLAAAGGVLLREAYRLADVGAGYAGVGPGAAPRIIGIGLLILAVWTVFDAIKGRFPARDPQAMGPILWITAGLILQLLLLKPLGFSVATGLMFAAVARAFGKRQLWLSVPLGIVLAFVIWLIFAKLLMLSLPAGPLERLFFPGMR